MKNLILLSGFLILCGCEELPFTNEDIIASTERPKNTKELDNIQAESKPPLSEKKEEAPVIQEETEEEKKIKSLLSWKETSLLFQKTWN